MSTIYLIRHGEIVQAEPRRFVGSSDLPLTDRGRKQIDRLTELLASQSIDRVICSPLSRCIDSAIILCARLGCKPKTVPELREISLGAWEGLTVEEVRQCFPGSYEARGKDLSEFRPPGGESFADLQHRTWQAFQTITEEGKEKVVVVAHAGVNRVILCRILDIPLANMFQLAQNYGCINLLHHDANGYRVESINCCPAAPESSDLSTHPCRAT
jgi:alpha-ribazole phosphatase